MNERAVDNTIRDEQAGFRSIIRSCTDLIVALRIIVRQSVVWQSFLYINFTDFEKVFDTVNRDGTWQLMRHYDTRSKIENTINALYENFSVQVIHGPIPC